MIAPRSIAIAAALILAGCGAGSPPPPPPRAAEVSAAADPPGPARWLYTDRLGAVFDEAGQGAPVPRPEPAIVDGVRMIVDGGVVTAWARDADRMSGLSSLPDRLGGGFVVWSEDRVYRAKTFLGDLVAIADVGAAGGVRPWMGSFLLRTPSGVLEVDPASLAIRRFAAPGLADARAADARRAARLDALGRATVTTDGGATWTDVLAASGAVVSALREDPDGSLVVVPDAGPALALGASGLRPHAEPASAPVDLRPARPLLLGALPATSRALPGELVAQAVALGAILPGGRMLVAREGGVRVLAASTGLPIDDADLSGVDERFAHCQAIALGAPPHAALACTGDAGALVLDLEASLTRPALEAVFPSPGAGFVAGPRGRLAFDGRCGRTPPGSLDLGPGTAKPPRPDEDPPDAAPPDPPAPGDPPPADDARVCVRLDATRWIERRLRGGDARRLYRWVPGDDGAVTALVLGDAAAGDEDGGVPPRDAEDDRPDGVRVLHLDPDDPALQGGAFPAPRAPTHEPPNRAIDTDFWQDDDGAVRGWIRLPDAGEEKVAAPPAPAGPAGRALRTTPLRGGRWSGVRIDAAGHVALLPLPDDVVAVVTGGPLALAEARGKDGGSAWFETLDGGASWSPVEAPPTGRIDPSLDDHTLAGCSPAGCTWGTGLVRLGWRGAAPSPRHDGDLALTPAVSRRPRDPDPLEIRCHLDLDTPPWTGAASSAPRRPPPPPAPPPRRPPRGAKPAPPPPKRAVPLSAPADPAPPIALRLPSATIGAVTDHTWTGDVIPLLQPAAAIRHVSMADRAIAAASGEVIPILGAGARSPLDLLLVVDRRSLRVGAAGKPLPFEVPAKTAIGADGPGGDLVLLDADHGTVWVSRGDATATAVRLTRVPDVSRRRLTLARRIAGGGLAIVAYSDTSGEVVAGDLDLGRAEVGPLASLARLDAVGEAGEGACAHPSATHRVLLELPVQVHVTGRGKRAFLDERVTASVLVAAGADRLCVEGVEAALPKGPSTVLSAVLGRGGSASVRVGGQGARAACELAGGR
jgi:hypothetical protein